MTTELHPLGFFLPENTRLLMLGSFPPPKARWSMDFYYPNIQNDMWRILGLIFYGNKDAFLRDKKAFSEEKAKAFCREKGIGIGDTAMEVIRLKANASDKFLEVVRPIDPEKVLSQIPECVAIVVTGQKAMDTLLSVLPGTEEPKVGFSSEFSCMGRTMRLFCRPDSCPDDIGWLSCDRLSLFLLPLLSFRLPILRSNLFFPYSFMLFSDYHFGMTDHFVV